MGTRSSNPSVTHIKKWQKKVIYIFYASLILKTVAAFIPALNFPSGINMQKTIQADVLCLDYFCRQFSQAFRSKALR